MNPELNIRIQLSAAIYHCTIGEIHEDSEKVANKKKIDHSWEVYADIVENTRMLIADGPEAFLHCIQLLNSCGHDSNWIHLGPKDFSSYLLELLGSIQSHLSPGRIQLRSAQRQCLYQQHFVVVPGTHHCWEDKVKCMMRPWPELLCTTGNRNTWLSELKSIALLLYPYSHVLRQSLIR